MINIDSIKKQIVKGDIDEQITAFNQIKSFITENLQAHQKQAEEKANDLQNKIDRINGN